MFFKGIPNHIPVLVLVFGLLFQTAALAEDFAWQFEQQFVLPMVDETPGGALIVVDHGEVVLLRVYGVRSETDQTPITESTLFRIASISKTFASAAASILVQDNLVQWQTPLVENLDYLKFKRQDYGGEINLHHLMSQSTGLMPHAYTNLIEDNMSFDRIVTRLDRVDFICEPGECYGYQNVVFSLIGNLVQATTAMDYETFVTNKLFKPLEMSRASFGMDAFVEDEDHAKPHIWTGIRWAPVPTKKNYYRVAPAAGVNASIGDMRQWLLAQLGHNQTVFHDGMLDRMHTGAIKTTRLQAHYRYHKELGDVYYGLGWRVFDYAGQGGFVHHGGYVRGMRSEMVFNRGLQTGMVFLTNSEPSGMGELVFDFVELHRETHDYISRALPSIGR
ncbi:MAG: serine hydrolase [Gammaproteobacteria bacterium]|nr:serine hydrolase [Gammaproteobacteria bacterium]|tara:strand:+ start:249 stop:1418 length:1170 start_codon:yes stop_codon:yes gene_type:complete